MQTAPDREAQAHVFVLVQPQTAEHDAAVQRLKLHIENELLIERCPFCGVTAPLPGDWSGCMMIKCGMSQQSSRQVSTESCFEREGWQYCGCCCQLESSPSCVGGLEHYDGGLMPIVANLREVWDRRLTLRQGKLDAFLRDNVNSQQLFDVLVVAMQHSPALSDPAWPRSLRLQWSQPPTTPPHVTQQLQHAVAEVQRLIAAPSVSLAMQAGRLTYQPEHPRDFTDALLCEVAARYPQLEHLNVSMCKQLTDVSMLAVAECCPQLRHLNVSSCNQLTDASLRAVAEHCPQLQHLNVSGCKQLTDVSLRAVAAYCPRMQHLDVNGCNQLTDASLLAVAAHCPEQQHLDVTDCNQLTDTSLLTVARRCPQLRHLTIKGCKQLTNVSLLTVATHCPELQHLDVKGCNQLTDASLRAVVAHCRKLQHLDAHRCSD